MTEAEARRMHFEDGRRGHREGMQEAETDKEADSPLGPPEGTQPCRHQGFQTSETSALQNCKIINYF